MKSLKLLIEECVEIKCVFQMKGYLLQRFLRNNHPKYHKYAAEWIENVTETQLLYYKLEKERLNL